MNPYLQVVHEEKQFIFGGEIIKKCHAVFYLLKENLHVLFLMHFEKIL